VSLTQTQQPLADPAATPPFSPFPPVKKSSRVRRFFLWLSAFCFLLFLIFLLRAPLLLGAAKVWIVNDPLQKADAIAVLGGGLETRPFEAARLYQRGLAPVVLIMNQKPSPTATLGITPTEADLTRQVLIKQGVPESSVVLVGENITNTHDESNAVREWVSAHAARNLIIVTDLFHTRRVRWLFRKQLRSTGATPIMDATPVREYALEDWWHHEQGVVAFQNEVLKYAYYRVRY
jgi:uncharacterized SAM-binding protein YcdF (DUF218 family)